MSWLTNLIPAAIGAVTSLFGGRKREESAEQANAANAAMQREFAQQGIQWRVADAKAAGIHPLYALGASTPSFSPSFVIPEGPDYGAIGQNVARAAQAVLDPSEKAMNAARLKVLESEAEKNFAMASAAKSEEQRAWLSSWTSKGVPGLGLDGSGLKADPFWALSSDVGMHRARSNEAQMGDQVPLGAVSGPPGRVKAVPDEVVSARRGAPQLSAGSHPAWQEYQVAPGFRMQLPRSDEGPGEALENIPYMLWPSVLLHNRRYYGKDVFDRAFSRWMMGLEVEDSPPRFVRKGSPFDRPRSKVDGDGGTFHGAP